MKFNSSLQIETWNDLDFCWFIFFQEIAKNFKKIKCYFILFKD